ncbi:MAG TPA: hypothetical protein VJ206_01580 [bacterium]|nr:hypothetical protein [bacterium]
MPPLRITLACGPYDRTEALRTGLIQPEAFDVSEMSMLNDLLVEGAIDALIGTRRPVALGKDACIVRLLIGE